MADPVPKKCKIDLVKFTRAKVNMVNKAIQRLHKASLTPKKISLIMNKNMSNVYQTLRTVKAMDCHFWTVETAMAMTTAVTLANVRHMREMARKNPVRSL